MMRRIGVFGFGAWVLWRLFGPEIPPRTIGAQVRPGPLPGRLVTVGRHEFLVREIGPADGPPLVLIHGWVYDSLATWHRVAPLLADGRRVLTVDLHGHGRTDRIRGRYDLTEMADDVVGVLTAVGVSRAPVIGYSMGGMVAQALAHRHPGLVERLVLAATAAHPVRLPRWVTVPAFLMGRALARLDRFIAPRIAYRYLTATEVIPPEHRAWLWEALLDRDVDLYYESGFAILRFDGRPWLAGIGVPTLSIVPTADQLIPAGYQRDTAARLPDNEVIEIEGARHEAVLTHPGEVAEAILEFLTR
jgi:3-oxoadipate enol-lactonase